MIPKLEQKFGKNYTFSVIESNPTLPSLSRIRTKCLVHKTETDDLFINLLHKPLPCLQCLMEDVIVETKVKRKKRNVDELISDFEKKHKGRFMYHDIQYSFKTMKDLVWIKCKKHNHWFEQSPVNHLNTEICCPKCVDEFINSDDT